jgi:hypothetical protein
MTIWSGRIRDDSAEKCSETKGRATLPPFSSLSILKYIVKDKKRTKFIANDQNTSSKNFEVLSFADNKRIVGDNI